MERKTEVRNDMKTQDLTKWLSDELHSDDARIYMRLGLLPVSTEPLLVRQGRRRDQHRHHGPKENILP